MTNNDQETDDQEHPKYVWHFTEEQPCLDCERYDKKHRTRKWYLVKGVTKQQKKLPVLLLKLRRFWYGNPS